MALSLITGIPKQAQEENLILRTADGREFVLAEIDDFSREIELTRQNEQLMSLLDSREQEKGTVSLAEARARLISDLEPENSKNGLEYIQAHCGGLHSINARFGGSMSCERRSPQPATPASFERALSEPQIDAD